MRPATRALVIVGAGHGGSTLAALLRQSGFDEPVVLVGSETHIPYHRPPLSKKFGAQGFRQDIRPSEFYADNDIELRTGTTVTAIDRSVRTVTLSTGERIEYAHLVLATGSSPRRLTVRGCDTTGVLTLRTVEDAAALARSMAGGGELAIIGGGYVGMEVAAVARSLDVPVTVIEREARILARVASPDLSQMLTDYHRQRGTAIRVDAVVEGILEQGGRATGVELADGSTVTAGTVLVGIGATPDDALAHTAGLACDGGVLVDSSGRTSDPSVFAIGDVARRPIDDSGTLVRLESIPNVTEQAKQVVAALTGLRQPEPEVPWFWSDQFDIKLKIAGLVRPGARIVHRPGKREGSFALYHLGADETVHAVEAANAPSDFIAGKKFISQRIPVSPNALGDPSVSLHEVAGATPVGS
ncbi:FAD-dependent oxidoreductase [Gordonia terrae]|uniref:NAD(P)/FAD-dependent oxidoreductase n=1 Tax=Gordonia terrae TaxID=2055 RepID=UPI00200A22C6|nr:FAD-dependent oxidoreductase [Gordonia terrae]UPW11868.1 FAD-dependent oxidoreductase [Gordonia terrae]